MVYIPIKFSLCDSSVQLRWRLHVRSGVLERWTLEFTIFAVWCDQLWTLEFTVLQCVSWPALNSRIHGYWVCSLPALNSRVHRQRIQTCIDFEICIIYRTMIWPPNMEISVHLRHSSIRIQERAVCNLLPCVPTCCQWQASCELRLLATNLSLVDLKPKLNHGVLHHYTQTASVFHFNVCILSMQFCTSWQNHCQIANAQTLRVTLTAQPHCIHWYSAVTPITLRRVNAMLAST